MTERCVSCGEGRAWSLGLCFDCEGHETWESLPPETQAEIDRLIRERLQLQAIIAFRENGSPKPSLAAAKSYVLGVRCEALRLKPGSPSE
jgi:hypothetical protein